MNFPIEEINRLMQTRRSVFPRDYTGERVPENVIRQMLENARWAPTHKFTEPWRVVVFAGLGLKRLAEFQSECYRTVTTAKGSFREDRYEALKTKPMQSSHILAIGMKRDSGKGIPEAEELGAVFCAIQNMYLTATACGAGCYLSTGGITYMEEAKSFFGWGPEDKLVGFLHVGMPARWPAQGKRKLVDEFTTWNID
jgi:nitroreductase